MPYETTILQAMQQITAQKSIAVLGIDGLGGAGKSTVSESICAALRQQGLRTILLHIDDFIHVRAIRYDDAYPDWQCYYDLQWRYDYFREVIRALQETGRCKVELYDKDNDCYFTEQAAAEGKTVIVVEGIFLQRRELAGVFDYMLYIDVPEDVRLQRVLKRDTYIGNEQQIVDKYENRYFPAERRYAAAYRPDMAADLVIRE